MKGQRYYTEVELCTLIDRCYAKSNGALAKCDQIEVQIIQLRQEPNRRTYIEELRDKQRRLRVYANNQIDKSAQRLKDKLAEMRTGILPWGPRDSRNLRANDRSVPAE